ncbi:MAG: YlxR family protein [Microbacteriaceae bacterium]|nr:YlxR family protein [Microbacteriaceae bacterium]
MEPERTCIGCRIRSTKSSLVRFVEKNGSLVCDGRNVEFGRGAWIHPTVQCLDTALSRKAFGRALRAHVSVTHEARAQLVQELERSVPVSSHQAKAERLMDN